MMLLFLTTFGGFSGENSIPVYRMGGGGVLLTLCFSLETLSWRPPNNMPGCLQGGAILFIIFGCCAFFTEAYGCSC